MTSRFRFSFVAVGAVMLAANFPVRATDPKDCPSDAPPAAPAQRIAIDPRTGMIAPATAVPSASAAPAVRSVPLAGVRLPSGAVRVDLKGRYQMAVVAHRDAAGKITTTCERTGTPPAQPAAGAPGEVACEK